MLTLLTTAPIIFEQRHGRRPFPGLFTQFQALICGHLCKTIISCNYHCARDNLAGPRSTGVGVLMREGISLVGPSMSLAKCVENQGIIEGGVQTIHPRKRRLVMHLNHPHSNHHYLPQPRKHLQNHSCLSCDLLSALKHVI